MPTLKSNFSREKNGWELKALPHTVANRQYGCVVAKNTSAEEQIKNPTQRVGFFITSLSAIVIVDRFYCQFICWSFSVLFQKIKDASPYKIYYNEQKEIWQMIRCHNKS